ncbi:MAG: hypothetical protein AMS21_04315 [Gemmatimonas sp. SG8_38_2]|nr:MAG: hypothetical protein AMS21_04315 [Gemmatimonas sp. SG8_38_2]
MDLKAFLAELKRRRVYRVAVVYAAVAFVIWQAAEIAFPALGLPDWPLTLVVVLTLIGFPVALVLAWAFELTAGGVTRTEPRPDEAPSGRMARFALALLVVLLVALGAWWAIDRYAPTDVEVTSTAIAVLPFSVHGGDEFAYLSSGMVDLLSRKLDGAGEFRKIDPHMLASFVNQQGYTYPGPEEGRLVAERFGAGLYVLGSVVEAGGRLEVSASLYDRSGNLQAEAVTTAGDESQIFASVDTLARQLLAREFEVRGEHLTGVAALTTSSISAFKAYVEGVNAFRVGEYSRAFEAFGRAVVEDTAFALAHYWKGKAACYLGDSVLARQEVDLALAHQERLGEQERPLIRAFAAWLGGAADEPERLLREVIRAYPEDFAAWYLLGEVLFHQNPLRGRSIAESREIWERVLEVEPDHVGALEHLWSIPVGLAAVDERSLAEVDSLGARYLSVDPDGDRAMLVKTVQAVVRQDAVAQERAREELREASDFVIHNTLWPVAVMVRDRTYLLSLARLMTEATRPAVVRGVGLIYTAHIEMSRGRLNAALAELEAAAAFDAAGAVENHALFVAAPFVPVSRDELEATREIVLRSELARTDTIASAPSFWTPHDGHHGLIESYLLGLLAARLRDDLAALERAAELEGRGGPPSAPAVSDDLARGVRARVAWEKGDFSDALRELELAGLEVTWDGVWASPFLAHGHERFARAELLHALGRDDEALAWYSTFTYVFTAYDLIYRAPSHFRQGEIYETLGDREKAVAHYSRFIELWNDCDPRFRAQVEEAEQRLAQLRIGT